MNDERSGKATGERAAEAWRRTAVAFACGVAVLGMLALIGWVADIDVLKRVRAGWVSMNPATVIAFLLSAVSILALTRRSAGDAAPRSPWGRAVGLGCAGGAMLVGITSLLRDYGGINLAVDRLFFTGTLDAGQSIPSRMAPNTAMCFVFVSGSLVLLHSRAPRLRIAALLLAIAAGSMALLALIGYANGVSSLSTVGPLISMAMHTAVGFVLLSASVVSFFYAGALAAATSDDHADATSSAQRNATVGFAAALVMLAVVGVATFKSINQFRESSDWTTHTLQVLDTIARLGANMTDAETGSRGFVISGQDDYLQPYQTATRAASEILRELRDLTADNARQQDRLSTLEPLLAKKLALMEQTIDVRRREGFDPAKQLVNSGEGKRAMDGVRQTLAAMELDEREMLRVRSAATEWGAKMSVVLISAGSVLGAVLLAGAGLLIRRDIARRLAVESALRVSEREMFKAKQIAESASSAKSEFLAHMSHEIRTPLNGVIGMIDLLLGTELSTHQRRFGTLAKTSAESLTTVVNDILDFSKIEAGKLEIVPTEFNLHTTVEEVMEVLATKAGHKGLEMACHVHESVPVLVHCDSDRLRQILVNLLNNAIKFTQTGAVILRVTAEEHHGKQATIRFTVTDTGIGIPADRIDRLFKAFSQADASTTRVFGGSGLGLAISKQLAELMGGAIGVQSDAGKGSTFWFTIRCDVPEQPVGPRGQRQVDPRTLRVLAVDDNDLHRETLREQIASWGLDAATAPNGAAALQILSEAVAGSTPFRVAIVDSDMPGMDGFELAAAIKDREEIQSTVLMILLSLETEIEPDRLRSMGFAGHMTKPVRQSQLFDAIMSAVAAAKTDPVPTLPSPPPRANVASPTPSAPAGGVRVLLAEDNEINQVVASEVLRKSGYQCEIVANGKAAVDAVRLQRFDVVLMDCQMPVMDGFEATREIRRMEQADQLSGNPSNRLPIIALTANAMKGDRERCLEAGMDSYTSKPIKPHELLHAIEDAMKGSVPAQTRGDVSW